MGIKKMIRKKLKIFNPIMGKKVGNALLGDDKKEGPADPGLDVFGNRLQGTEFYQSELDKEGENWRTTPEKQRGEVTEAMRRAGTFSASREGTASVNAEAEARSRGLRSASQNRINLLRKQLGLPEAQMA